MERVVDYQVLSAASDTELVALVKRFISQGWEPLGGPVLIQDQENVGKLLQAIVTRIDSD